MVAESVSPAISYAPCDRVDRGPELREDEHDQDDEDRTPHRIPDVGELILEVGRGDRPIFGCRQLEFAGSWFQPLIDRGFYIRRN